MVRAEPVVVSPVRARLVPTPARDEQPDDDRGNLWQRLQSGLKKTRDVHKTDIRDLFKTDGQLVDDEFLTRLFAILVKTDSYVNSIGILKSHNSYNLGG